MTRRWWAVAMILPLLVVSGCAGASQHRQEVGDDEGERMTVGAPGAGLSDEPVQPELAPEEAPPVDEEELDLPVLASTARRTEPRTEGSAAMVAPAPRPVPSDRPLPPRCEPCPVPQIQVQGVTLAHVHLALAKAGYGAMSEWGQYGEKTADSVKRFQVSNYLSDTGIVDPATWVLLSQYASSD